MTQLRRCERRRLGEAMVVSAAFCGWGVWEDLLDGHAGSFFRGP